MDLRALYIFKSFSAVIVVRRPLPTYNDGPRAERVKGLMPEAGLDNLRLRTLTLYHLLTNK